MRRYDTDEGSVDPIGGGMPLSGVAVAEVIDNIDPTNQGRVQLSLPWLPDVRPWGRVASLSGGRQRGMYFMPQVGDEVLVAFHHGDVREVYVIGSLWSSKQAAPTKSTLDPVNRRVIHTPAGHDIELDDLEKSVTVKTLTGQTLRMEPDKIEISTNGGTAKIVLETNGAITVSTNVSIEMKAPQITLEATTLELKGSTTKLTGDAMCQIQGGMVKIN